MDRGGILVSGLRREPSAFSKTAEDAKAVCKDELFAAVQSGQLALDRALVDLILYEQDTQDIQFHPVYPVHRVLIYR